MVRKTENVEFGAVRKRVNLVDLEECCKMSIQYLGAKIGVDPAENEPSKDL